MASALDSLIDPAAPLSCLGHGVRVHRGSGLGARRTQPLLQRHPGRHTLALERGEGMEIAARPTFKGNGMALDNDGNILVCEQVSSCLVRLRSGGGRDLVAFHYRGKYLNSPNDVVTRGSDGSIYFTDPDYGRWNDWIGQERSRDQLGYPRPLPCAAGRRRTRAGGRRGRVRPAERPVLLAGREHPLRQRLRSTQRQGVRRRRRRLARPEPAAARRHRQRRPSRGQRRRDGMRRARKRLGHRAGRRVGADARGQHLGVVETPEVCGSHAWGGEDLHSLFLMTTTSVHVVTTLVGPAPLPPF